MKDGGHDTARAQRSVDAAPRRTTPADAAGLFARGLAMGAADIVPGVSGGTIAFITGIYERFIEALRSLSPAFLVALVRGRRREAVSAFAAMHWGFLVPLGAGVLAAVALMSGFITRMMDERPGPTFAFFFGLILASAWIPFARMRERRVLHAVAAILAAAGAFLFVGLQASGPALRVARAEPGATAVVYAGKLRTPQDVEAINALLSAAPEAAGATSVALLDSKGLIGSGRVAAPARAVVFEDEASLEAWLADSPPLVVVAEDRAPLAWIYVCGAVAICAMVLPGVSGSFLLLFLGQYHAVLGAIQGVIGAGLSLAGRDPDALTALAGRPWWSDFLFLGVFGLGVLTGLAAFSRLVSWLLHRAHDVTMAALTGLMIGALRQPAREVMTAAPGAAGAPGVDTGGYWGWVAGAALIGAALVLGLWAADAIAQSRRAASAS